MLLEPADVRTGMAGTTWRVVTTVGLGPDRLALLGTFPGLTDGARLRATSAAATRDVVARVHELAQGTLAVVPVEGLGPVQSTGLHLALPGRRDAGVDTGEAGELGELLRCGIAALPDAARAAVLAFLVDSTGEGRDALPQRLARDLWTAREVLRPRRRPTVVDRHAGRGMTVEVVASIDPHAFYARGWIGFGSDDVVSLTAVSPEGARIDLTDRLYRFARHDVADFYGEDEDAVGYGFACYFTLEGPSALDEGWVFELTAGDDLPMEGVAPPVVSGHVVRDLLIGDLAIEHLPRHDLRRDHLVPAVTRLQEGARRRVRIAFVEQLGDPPTSPDVSVIVPLYRRLDFVEHQLAQFVHDPELRASDLIYVLDSPELRDEFVAEAPRLFRLYHVPFRVVVLSHNAGFSTANNLAAGLARGRLLLLLNSDVLPAGPGWLGELIRFHDAVPSVGTVGPKLLFEDDSIQHAGMYFERPLGGSLWSNEHYFKGLHRSFPPACRSRRVPAVTAACMLVARELYEAFGGLRGGYVQGDFEDSDFCLRLTEAGYEHWYAAHVELYHLEGQSYPTPMRVLNGNFNRWLHTHLWGPLIEKTMAGEDG